MEQCKEWMAKRIEAAQQKRKLDMYWVEIGRRRSSGGKKALCV